jgi:hypothetical protein
MILVVFSVFAVWSYQTFPGLPVGAVGLGPVIRHGNGVLGWLMWALLVSAIAAATLLLFTPTPRSRLTLAISQGVCGLLCVAIAIRYLALETGPLVALAGGAMLVAGAIERMSARQ